jgi:hypothetical protein
MLNCNQMQKICYRSCMLLTEVQLHGQAMSGLRTSSMQQAECWPSSDVCSILKM